METWNAVPDVRGATRLVSFEASCAERTDDLVRLALLLTGNETDAQDATQDALECAFKSWERIQSAQSPYAYVRSRVVNASRSSWRRHRARETPVANVFEPGPEPAVEPAQDPAQVAVWESCLALPQHQKVVVVLRFYEGPSYAEIGETAGCSEATAHTRVFRGLGRMRERLGEGGR